MRSGETDFLLARTGAIDRRGRPENWKRVQIYVRESILHEKFQSHLMRPLASVYKPYRNQRFLYTFGPQEDFQKGSEREYYFNTYTLDLTKYHMMFIFQPNWGIIID